MGENFLLLVEGKVSLGVKKAKKEKKKIKVEDFFEINWKRLNQLLIKIFKEKMLNLSKFNFYFLNFSILIRK